jgi:hypothetical protein
MASYSESFPGLLEEYLTFLQHHRGLREATLYFHRRWGERFLHHLAEHLPDRDLTRLTIPIVDAFVLPLARSVGRATQWQIRKSLGERCSSTRRIAAHAASGFSGRTTETNGTDKLYEAAMKVYAFLVVRACSVLQAPDRPELIFYDR